MNNERKNMDSIENINNEIESIVELYRTQSLSELQLLQVQLLEVYKAVRDDELFQFDPKDSTKIIERLEGNAAFLTGTFSNFGGLELARRFTSDLIAEYFPKILPANQEIDAASRQRGLEIAEGSDEAYEQWRDQ